MKFLSFLCFICCAQLLYAQPDSWEVLNPVQDNGYFPNVPNSGIFYSENFDKVYLYDPINYYLDEGFNEYVMSHHLTSFDGLSWNPLIETNDDQWGRIQKMIDIEEGFAFVKRDGLVLNPNGYTVQYYDGETIAEIGSFQMANPFSCLSTDEDKLLFAGTFGLGEEQSFNIISYSFETETWSDAFETLPEVLYARPNCLTRFQENWYLGGGFNGNNQVDNLYSYDGVAWTQVVNENGFGLRGTIFEMLDYAGKLAIAIERIGLDYNLDEGIGSGVVFWDGLNWSGPQTLISFQGTPDLVRVRDIIVENNNLYALGTFYEAGGVQMRYLARWNGSQWCGLQADESQTGEFRMALFQNRIIQSCFSWGLLDKVYWHDGETLSPCTTPLSIEEVSTTDVVVYPNPINEGIFTINTEQRIDHLLMFDVQGRTVLSLKPTSTTLDVNALPTGVYFLEVSFETGSVVKKVVVQ